MIKKQFCFSLSFDGLFGFSQFGEYFNPKVRNSFFALLKIVAFFSTQSNQFSSPEKLVINPQ